MFLFQVKADFLDALSNAEKQVHDYELKLGVLNENLSKVGELLAYKFY